MENLEEQFGRVIRAVHDLGRESGNGWTSWHKVAVRAYGTSELVEMCSAIAELPEYSHYFHQTRKHTHVGLSEDGFQFIANATTPVALDPYAPKAVADAIIKYACKLHNIHIRVEDVAVVAHVGGKVVQAIQLEMSDGQLATGTRVTVKGQGPWTHGRVVGQDAESARIYVALAVRCRSLFLRRFMLRSVG